MQRLKIIIDPNDTQEILSAMHTLQLLLGNQTEKSFKVRLLQMSDKIRTIKAIRTLTNWGLKEAKAYLDNAVQTGFAVIPKGVDRDQLMHAFTDHGFEVSDG